MWEIWLEVEFLETESSSFHNDVTNYLTAQQHYFPEASSPAKMHINAPPLFMSTFLMVNHVYWFPSGWAQRRLLSMDTEDFETIPSSAEESSNSSDEEGNNKNVGNI